MANTWYVSNTASNGYALGVDQSANGTSKSTPLLSINYCIVNKLSSGDTIIINPSTAPASNPYVENSGSGYLQWPGFACTIMADATAMATYGNVIIQPVANTTRATNWNNATGTINVTGITIDGKSGNTNSSISMHTQAGTLTFSQCNFRNSANTAVPSGTGTNGNIIFDRCVFESTVNVGLDCGGTWTNYFIEGCTFNCVNNAVVCSATPSITYFHMTLGADSVTPTTLNIGTGASGGSIYFVTTGTITKLEMDNTVVNNYGAIYIPHGTIITSSHVFIHNNSCPGTVASPINLTQSAFFSVTGDLICSDVQIYGNTGVGNAVMVLIQAVQSSNVQMPPSGKAGNTYTGVNADAYGIVLTGTGLVVGPGNNWTALGTAPNIACIGTDGNYFNVVNNVSQTGFQPLGSTLNNVLLSQQFVTAAAGSTGYSPWLANVVIAMKANNSPTGNLTAYLYAASGGVPTGSALDTSVDTIAASTLTSSLLNYQFNFHGKYQMSPSTNYCIVLGTSQTFSATNYVNVATNTAYTGTGVLATSPAVQSWTTTSVSMSFQVQTGCFGISGYVVSGDTYTGAVTSGSSVEGLILASVAGGTVKNNLIYGGTIGLGTKNVIGSSTTSSAVLIYDNLIQAVGSLHGLQNKGSYGVFCYNNTVVYNPQGSGAGAYSMGSANGSSPAVINPPWNNYITLENNIFVVPSQPVANVVFQLNGAFNANPQIGNANFTSNYNVIYGGTNTTISDQYATWSLYQAAGYDTNSVNADPLLSNESNPTTALGFVPASTSPAKGIGINTNGIASSDYFGTNFAITPDAGAVSIAAYYAAGLANKIIFNPFTNNLDYEGLVASYAGTIYSAITTVFSTTSSIAIPPTNGRTIIFCNATSGNVVVTLPSAVGWLGTAVIVKTDSSSNSVSFGVISGSGQTISGTSSTTTQNASIEVASDNSNFHIIT